jgi:hypothetical protein
MVYRTLLSVALVCVALCSSALAQSSTYNPYASDVDLPLISEDGTINWPSFFQSAATEAKFQYYFQVGSCTGTRKSIVNMLKDNKVDVNKLPQTTLTGKAVKLLPGMVGVIDANGKTVMAVTHPQGVSRVNVSGETTQEAIRPGMTLRFAGKVDEHGKGIEVLESAEIVTLSDKIYPIAIKPNHPQTIVANVTKRRGNMLKLKLNVGDIRSLSILIAPDAKTTVNGHSLDLISLGDEVTVKGHAYSGAGVAASNTIFADEVVATKPVFSVSQ